MAQMEENSKVLMGRYELGKLLGQGTFAKVYHGKNIQTGSSVAIKVILKHKVSRVEMMDQIKREISVMRLIRHPNVVELYEVMATRTKIYFVMEYVKGGELFNKVAKGKLKEDVARKYFQQLINAVDYCHSRGVYHRDLKPENLLLDDKENLKISDFGLSALAESKHQDGLLHTTCGTPAYVAPEVIHRKGYNGAKADIWSCGVILYVLLAGYLPFHDSNLMELYRKIGNAEFRYPNWFSPEVRRLLTKILDPNPNTRISIAKIMESSWFKKGYKRVEPKMKKVYEPTVSECDSFFVQCENPVSSTEPRHNHTPETCHSMNAFDIISFSKGFDLSSLFDEKSPKKEVRFSARVAASTIITKLEDVAKRLRIKVGKKDGGTIKFEREKGGRKGVLSFEAEIFEVTPTFHMVEMKKCSGDTIEYQKILKDDIRPALKDIIWTWQGDQEQTAHQGNAALPSPSQRTEI